MNVIGKIQNLRMKQIVKNTGRTLKKGEVLGILITTLIPSKKEKLETLATMRIQIKYFYIRDGGVYS